MEKAGIDYMPLSTTFFEDSPIALIEAEFGSEGIVVVLKLFCAIYRNGFYMDWDRDISLLFARKTMLGMSAATVDKIVERALYRGIFDSVLYESYGVLTSADLQQHYFNVVVRRKKVEIWHPEYLLVDVSTLKNIHLHNDRKVVFECEPMRCRHDADRNAENVDINANNVDRSEQRREEYRRVKEEKENSLSVSLERVGESEGEMLNQVQHDKGHDCEDESDSPTRSVIPATETGSIPTAAPINVTPAANPMPATPAAAPINAIPVTAPTNTTPTAAPINATPPAETESFNPQWIVWKNELLHNDGWRISVINQSGQGVGFNDEIPFRLDRFCDFLISSGQEKTARRRGDFVRRFHYWLMDDVRRYNKRSTNQATTSRYDEATRAAQESLSMARQMLEGGWV